MEIINIIKDLLSLLIFPVFVYVINIERRLTKLETKIEICFKDIKQ